MSVSENRLRSFMSMYRVAKNLLSGPSEAKVAAAAFTIFYLATPLGEAAGFSGYSFSSASFFSSSA